MEKLPPWIADRQEYHDWIEAARNRHTQPVFDRTACGEADRRIKTSAVTALDGAVEQR